MCRYLSGGGGQRCGSGTAEINLEWATFLV